MSDAPQTDTSDPYQQRYLAHQRRKAAALRSLLLERHSERAFDDRPLADGDLSLLRQAVTTAPSSCDRHGTIFHEVSYNDRDKKAILGGLLVGGVGWVHRAPTVWLLFGDPDAYKAPGEAAFMPYLDAGVIVGQMLLAATSGGLAGCFINPNIRAEHRFAFDQLFAPVPGAVYCGAVAVGYPLAEQDRWLKVPGLTGWDDPKVRGMPGVFAPCTNCDPDGARFYCICPHPPLLPA